VALIALAPRQRTWRGQHQFGVIAVKRESECGLVAAASGSNLLVNGIIRVSVPDGYADGRWGAFSSIPGWTQSGSKIDLERPHGVKASDGANYGELDYVGAQDSFYQDVKPLPARATICF